MGNRGQNAQVCSVPRALVKGVEWRKVPLDMHQPCLQEGGFNILMPSQTQLAASCPTAPPCSALTAVLFCTHTYLSAFSDKQRSSLSAHPSPSLAPGQQIHHDHRKQSLSCAAIWWEKQLLGQLGNESLEGASLSPSLSSNSAHHSPGFMNLLVTQFSSARQHSSTTCATCCSDRW